MTKSPPTGGGTTIIAADDDWQRLLNILANPTDQALRQGLPNGLKDLFGPLIEKVTGAPLFFAQLGQSLDGRIATPTGHSHYINGPAGLEHLHRLRAVADAVVVGVGTVVADDPQLTVRRVAGNHPVRIVIDPRGRLPKGAKMLAPGVRRIVVTGEETKIDLAADVEVIRLSDDEGRIEPREICTVLGRLGFHRVLVEGGARTISNFLAAGCLDRLHILTAPVIIGSGPAGLDLPPIAHMAQALRPRVTAHAVGDEIVFDCDFRATPS